MNVREGIWLESSREMTEDKNLKLKEAGTFVDSDILKKAELLKNVFTKQKDTMK